MGSASSCIGLSGPGSTPFDIAFIIDKVIGVPSTSASPTDTWIVDLAGASRQKKAFVKLYVSNARDLLANVPSSPLPLELVARLDPDATRGLDYEMALYDRVRTTFLDSGLCENFVRLIGGRQGCSAAPIAALLTTPGKLDVPSASLVDTAVEQQQVAAATALSSFVRNMTYCLFNYPGRPALTDFTWGMPPLPGLGPQAHPNQQAVAASLRIRSFLMDWLLSSGLARFNVMLTEYEEGSVTLHRWIKDRRAYLVPSDHAAALAEPNDALEANDQLLCLVFQAIAAVVCMRNAGIAHNDLHLRNLLVVPRFVTASSSSSIPLTYIWQEQQHQHRGTPPPVELACFRCPWTVKVFDYDLSYASGLGPNPRLAPGNGLCPDYPLCNAIIPNLDAVRFCCSLAASGLVQLAEILVIPEDHPQPEQAKEFLRRSYSEGRCWFRGQGAMDQTWWAQWNSPERMLSILRDMLPEDSTCMFDPARYPLNVTLPAAYDSMHTTTALVTPPLHGGVLQKAREVARFADRTLADAIQERLRTFYHEGGLEQVVLGRSSSSSPADADPEMDDAVLRSMIAAIDAAAYEHLFNRRYSFSTQALRLRFDAWFAGLENRGPETTARLARAAQRFRLAAAYGTWQRDWDLLLRAVLPASSPTDPVASWFVLRGVLMSLQEGRAPDKTMIESLKSKFHRRFVQPAERDPEVRALSTVEARIRNDLSRLRTKLAAAEAQRLTVDPNALVVPDTNSATAQAFALGLDLRPS